jgi:DNA ligase (NAD+)
MFNDKQLEIISNTKLFKTNNNLTQLLQTKQLDDILDKDLLKILIITDVLYRHGYPIISDYLYDHIYLKELEKRYPDHPFLSHIDDYEDLDKVKITYKYMLLELV